MKLAIAVGLLLLALAALKAGKVNFDGVKRIRPTNGRSISTLPGLNAAQCGLYCVDEPDCSSFLIWNARTPAVACELRDQSTVDETMLEEDTAANYYSRRYCEERPCKNGGRCIGNLDRYTCVCVPGFTGGDCEIDVDECASNPCANGGVCTDEVNAYSCDCADGYAGSNCNTNVDECASNPCANGGACTDEVNAYSCDCAVGFAGSNCNTNVDECASNPCANGGACTDEVNAYSCQCTNGFSGSNCDANAPEDCRDIQIRVPGSGNGLYSVYPGGSTKVDVFCDMSADGGGWLVFQKRFNGQLDFYRSWEEYAAGFGDLQQEFWLGNRKLHQLTSQRSYTLRVYLEDSPGNTRYAKYSSFAVGPESDGFRLTVGGYTGTAGDSLVYHIGQQFTTVDQDNDGSSGNCAQTHTGAWWYNNCYHSNLNGQYQSVVWTHFSSSLKITMMMIRPTN